MEWLVASIVRIFIWLIGVLPGGVSRFILTNIIRFVVLLLPRYRKIAHINLKQAFPNLSEKERQVIIDDSYKSLARLIWDFARIPKLNMEWVEKHVEFPGPEILNKLSRNTPRKGCIFATGHLGSFELLAYAAGLKGFPMSFVVRNFPNKILDQWWNGRRGVYGNRVINRKGAVQNTIDAIEDGQDVGILFDQNLTRKHAIFAPFFGRLAATTKIIGIATLRTKVPVMVVCISYKGNDYYKIDCRECDCNEIYQNENISNEEKMRIITEKVSLIYESMVRENPEAWFWMHRRWKTTPEGVAEDFYSKDC